VKKTDILNTFRIIPLTLLAMKKENPYINLVFNIILPLVILTKLSKEEYLGPVWGLIVALAFPIIIGLYEFFVKKQKSVTSIIGFVGVLLTGVIGLLKFPPQWIAVKEAAIPLLIGIGILTSTNTTWQVISKFIYTKEIFDIDVIENKLNTNELQSQLKSKLTKANIFLSFSFFVSAVLNYILAKKIVHSLPGTAQFNEEIGKMTMLSFPVIALPSFLITLLIFWYIIASIKKLTQFSTDEVLSENLRSDK